MSQRQVMPQDLEAEMSLLGGLLLSPNRVGDVMAKIGDDHVFACSANQAIYDTLVEMFSADKEIDIITFEDALKSKDALKTVGGRGYLIDLINSVPGAENVEYYADIVIRHAKLRYLIRIGSSLTSSAWEQGADPVEIVAKVELDLLKQRSSSGHHGPVPMSSMVDEILRRIDDGASEPGIASGFSRLDDGLGGFRPGQLILLAARPSVGKTSLAVQIAASVATSGVPVLFFSLEMPARSIAQRLISIRSGVDGRDLQHGRIGEALKAKIERENRIGNIWIDDGSGLTASDIRSRSRAAKMQHDIGLVVIDYLGLMRDPQGERQGRTAAVSNLSREVKTMARELDIPVLCLQQLSRDVEKQKRLPVLSDLRDSGTLEQDADCVMFLHIPDEMVGDRPASYPVQLIVKKNREGPLCTLQFDFHAPTTSFSDPKGVASSGCQPDLQFYAQDDAAPF